MKFTIQSLQPQQVRTKYGPKLKYRITSDGKEYDIWERKGFTDNYQFKVGYSFEADLSGKPYKGVDTIAWPKQDTRGPSLQNSQLDRIEVKLNRILRHLNLVEYNPKNETIPNNQIDTNIDYSGKIPLDIPFAGDPFPDSKDEPF